MKSDNKTLLASGTLLALSIMMVAGLSFASAHGGDEEGRKWASKAEMSEERLAKKAELLEISAEDLKSRLDSGENFRDIAESLGFTKEEMEAKIKERATNHVEELLADGEITQEKADEMLERIESGEFRKHRKAFRRGFIKGIHASHGDSNGVETITLTTE